MRAVAQTISRLFSLWFTIVRRVSDMTVRGGVSLGARSLVSGKGLTSFGSATVASNLHHETLHVIDETLILAISDGCTTHAFVLHMRLFDLQPAWSLDFSLQDKKLERRRVGTKNLGKVWRCNIVRYLRFCEDVRRHLQSGKDALPSKP